MKDDHLSLKDAKRMPTKIFMKKKMRMKTTMDIIAMKRYFFLKLRHNKRIDLNRIIIKNI